MLKKIKRLLRGPLPTVDAIDAATKTIVLPALEVALADAQRHRAAILLDGSVDDILAAERKVDEARIELERGNVALAELDRRRAEAEAKAAQADLEHRRAAVQQQVDEAVSRIENEYPTAAAKIAELAELAAEADKAARAWLRDVADDKAGGLPVVDNVAQRIGWHDEFFCPPDFADVPVLPPVGKFCGYRDAELVTHTRHYAVAGAGTGGQLVAAQQERGPRWGRL